MTQHLFRTVMTLWVLGIAATASGQSTTYYLRNENSSTLGLLQLSTTGSGSTPVVIQSGELKNLPPGGRR
jgi:hypothetical protein